MQALESAALSHAAPSNEKPSSSAVVADQREEELQFLERLPLDFTLKSQASFESNVEMGWVRTIRATPPLLSPPSNGYQSVWGRALVYHETAYRASGVSPAVEELADWRESLRSLYYQWRHGECDYFYLVARDFTILWLRSSDCPCSRTPAEWGDCECIVLLSQSSSAWRAKLKASLVEFSLPNDTENAIEEADKCDQEATRYLRGANEGGTHTMLEVKGHSNVGGLYDLVLQESSRLGAPTLLARQPFLHSRSSSIRLGYIGKVKTAAGNRARTHHRLELKGWLLPCAVRELCQAVAVSKGDPSFAVDFTVKKDTTVFASR
jgi:hypothetical protein